MSTPETPAPLSFDDADTITKLASILSRTNGVGPILAQRISEIVAPVLSNFASKIKQTEAERDRYRAALEFEYKENRKLTRGAVIFDFEMFVIEQVRRIEAALSGMPAQAGEDAWVKKSPAERLSDLVGAREAARILNQPLPAVPDATEREDRAIPVQDCEKNPVQPDPFGLV